LPGERVSPAARVALPTTVAALSVALAYDGVRTLTPLARFGVKTASGVGASRRAALLERVSRVGPVALAEATFVQPLLHVASPAERGLLTPADFAGPPDVSVDAKISRNREGAVLEAPWANDASNEASSEGHAACAVDARGVFAALCYREITDGPTVSELELLLSLGAVPVRRGERRVRPGERLPAPAPATIRCDAVLTPLEVRVRREPNARRTLVIARASGRWLEASTR
jgi:hypothetical protein